MDGYVKTFKLKDGDEDKSNNLMSFQIDADTILEKYKKIEKILKILNMWNWMLYQAMMIPVDN